jgi:hypothetical protein
LIFCNARRFACVADPRVIVIVRNPSRVSVEPLRSSAFSLARIVPLPRFNGPLPRGLALRILKL